MTLPQDSSRLAELPVLLFDAQATAAHAARGTLLEIGWARSSTAAPADAADVEACLVAPPPGTGLPRAIARLTGVRRGEWERGATPAAAWARLLVAAAALGPSPVPLVVHFARFEEPFLRALHGRHGSGPLPFEPICTHAIARRLLPGLPRCTLRALAGYFGAAVSTLRRSADHVLATGLVWSQLVAMLQERGIGEPAALRAWLRSPAPRARRAARAYPLPAGLRHALPRGPGVYRFLRQGGAVLYVGKATSVRHRVNGHFHARDNERALEMLSQVRDVSCTPTASALEAALLEADEIKRLAPPYNRALAAADRSVWFATSELCDLREAPDDDHTVGPLSSRALFDSLEALRRALRTGRPVPLAARAIALGLDPAYAPAPRSFADGCARFAERHGRLATTRDVLRVGARLWTSRCERSTPAAESPGADGPPTEASRWDAKTVLEALEDTVLRCAHAVRRARWLVRLSEASLAWSEPGHPGLRLLTITRGAVTACDPAGDGGPPIPTGAHRDLAERRAAFDLPTFDRLRVLTTELRTLATHAQPPELRLGERVRLSGRRLRTVLLWV
jgi:DNA polymerase-3 subunit epsilon